MQDFSIFRREIANKRYEVAENGLYLPNSHVMLQGCYEHEVVRNGESLGVIRDHNLVVNEGLNSVLEVALGGGTQIAAWYIGIFEGNYTPVATDTAASIAGNSTESTAYTAATRPAATFAAAASQSITNSASKATFSINATKTIYGAFLISDSTKSGTTGTLMSASAFAASRAVVSGDTLNISYTMSAADA